MRIAALATAFSLLSAGVLAQEFDQVNLDELNYCLGEIGYKGSSDPWDCVGFIAAFCRQGVADASDQAAIVCLNREKSVWQAVLEEQMASLRSKMEPSAFARLAEQRSASPASHAEHCEAQGETSVATARCLRDMMARRALFVQFYAADLADAP